MRILTPELKDVGQIVVTYDGHPVGDLADLEWVRERLWATHSQQNEILIINPDDGKVIAFVNVRSYNQASTPGCCVCGAPIASGIAYNPDSDVVYLGYVFQQLLKCFYG